MKFPQLTILAFSLSLFLTLTTSAADFVLAPADTQAIITEFTRKLSVFLNKQIAAHPEYVFYCSIQINDSCVSTWHLYRSINSPELVATQHAKINHRSSHYLTKDEMKHAPSLLSVLKTNAATLLAKQVSIKAYLKTPLRYFWKPKELSYTFELNQMLQNAYNAHCFDADSTSIYSPLSTRLAE